MNQKLIIFDMDGVIFEGKNFWLELHKLMGTERQAWQLWNGLGNNDFQKLSDITAMKLWGNKSSAAFIKLINERRPTKGIDAVFSYLHDNNIKSAIVSSGPYQLAERAKEMFGIDVIRANKLEIGKNGYFTGKVDVQVDENKKDISAIEIMNELGANQDTTATIGDSISDSMIAKVASLSIAYDTVDVDLLSMCKYRLKAGEIYKAVELLKSEGY